MGLFDFFKSNKKKPSIDLSDYKFLSDDHSRIENGKPTNIDNKGAWRGITVKTSDSITFYVTMYNMNGNHPVWGDNIQMAEKRMKMIEENNDKIILRGFGADSMSDYGITLHKNQNNIEEITLHMFDRNIEIVYFKAKEKIKDEVVHKFLSDDHSRIENGKPTNIELISKMTDDNKNENASIPIGSKDLDLLKWWSELGDVLKIGFYINLKFKTELDIKKIGKTISNEMPKLYNFFNEKLKSLKTETDSIRKLDKETIKSILNLKELYLQSNEIPDISLLSNLTNLTSLSLPNNNIPDIGLLSNSTDLEWLNLDINKISDISALLNLANLTTLNLGNNKISDISALLNLTNLTGLNLQRNEISDISALSDLTSLTELYLGYNKIPDISILSNLTNLTMLDLGSNSISDISGLSNLTNLTELILLGNKISDISSLSNLTNLTELYLNGSNISDISSLSNLTNLTMLNLRYNKISNISALSNLTNLTTLDLDENKISDISSLSNLTNLKTLNLLGNHIPYEQIEYLKNKLPNCDISHY